MRIKITNIAGMNGYIDPAKLSESEFALLENYTLKSYGNVGSLVSRPGIQRYGDTQIASGGTGVGSGFEATLNGTDYMITNIINGGSSALYYKASPYTTGAWTAITGANGSAQGYKLNYASFKDKVYIANRTAGTATNTVWDGTTAGFYDMGCPPPNSSSVTATPSNSSGLLTVGSTYLYLFTFIYDNGQESGVMGFVNTATGGADDTMTLSTIPIAPWSGTANARITGRKVYRTKAGGGVFYYNATILNNTDTTYVDLVADTSLGPAIDLDFYRAINAPDSSKYICVHKERTVPAYLYSDIYSAPTSGNITLTGSDTGGSMGSGIYKYRFYYANYVFNGATVYVTAGLYTEKTVNMSGFTGTDNAVDIDWTALAKRNWFNALYIERTLVGGSDFRRLVVTEDTTYTDITGDTTLGVTAFLWDTLKVDNYIVTNPGLLKASNGNEPDSFDIVEVAEDGTLTNAKNEWNIGEPITGIHSEENRIVIFANNNIHELDTRSQSRIFWNTNKIVSGIGADDGLQVQCGNKYVFVKTSQITKNKITVYEWDGRNEPEPCELAIRKYIADLNGTGAVTIKDLRYDQLNSQVHIIAQYTDDLLVSRTIIFIYNLDIRDSLGLGKWEIWLNATNLNLNIGIQTKNYGLLYGGGDGYIQYPLVTSYRDVIAGSGALFTTKLRTKTFETFDSDLMPKNFRADITSTGAITPSLKTAVDGTLNSGDNMPALASGFNRPRLTGFTNAQGKSFRQVYFQLEMSANEQYKVHGLTIDFDESAGDAGGR